VTIDLRIIRAGIHVLGENPKKTDGEKNDREKDVELIPGGPRCHITGTNYQG
jgi:hypothetical protein